MKQILYISLAFFTLTACRQSFVDREKPSNLLPHDEMVVVLKELVKLEAHIKSKYAAVTQYHNAMKLSGDSLMKAHGISFETFDASMDYYGKDQKEMKSIYSDVLDQLNHELGQLQSE